MDKNNFVVSTHDLFPIIEELLAMDRQAIFTVKGRSMLPFIGDNRDQVILEKRDFSSLKKGDIILFKNKYNSYILHRIYKVTDRGYLTIGDGNLHFDGYVDINEIIGVVSKIIRKEKEIDCSLYHWKFIFSLWMKLLPIRGTLLRIYSKLSWIKRKIVDNKWEKEHNKNIVEKYILYKNKLRLIKIISKSGAKNEDKQGFYDSRNSR